MHSVALTIVYRDPVAVHLGDAIWAARIEWGLLALRHLDNFAEHFGRAGLVEANIGVDDPNRVEHTCHAERGRLAGDQCDLLLDVADALEIDGAGSADHADHFVALR